MDEREKEIFADILDENEKVIAVIRPNRKKYWAFFNWFMFWTVPCFFLGAILLTFCLYIDGQHTFTVPLWQSLLVAGSIGLCISIFMYLIWFTFAKLAYKKRYYAYTDKRILIRCGVIGVDYKILDYKSLGATSVTVGLLDRIMGGKTGYIRFGSASAPITSAGASSYVVSDYTFAHVDKPYELLREIKKTMNGAQEQEKK